jgi:hypothetical protein
MPDYVTRQDGVIVATEDLDAEDLTFLAAEVDHETADELRELAERLPKPEPLPPAGQRCLMPDPDTGEPVEVVVMGPSNSHPDRVSVRRKRHDSRTTLLVSPQLLKPLS